MKKILFVGAEAMPFAATGGLGDVLGSLPAALAATGECDIRVVIPLYETAAKTWKSKMTRLAEFQVQLAWRSLYCGVWSLEQNGVTYYFIDNEYYFRRPALYGHYDDGERYAYFCMAVLEMMRQISFFPDVLHAHDWQAALSVVYLNCIYRSTPGYENIRTVFTIHNIEYQGQYDFAILGDVFALGNDQHTLMENDGCINLMKAAIECADRVTTVSPRYAEEIKTAEYGHGLEASLNRASGKLCGILNGIDYDYYNPETDPSIAAAFTRRALAGKAKDKMAMQKECGLPVRREIPMLSVISRLASHKGLDLVVDSIEHIVAQNDVQFLILGRGEERYERFFIDFQNRHPDRVRARICYDRDLSKRVYAATDIFLMPSKTEPCGLSQMIASRYGAIPVVRETGGLYDSIKPYWIDEAGELHGNGFTFAGYTAEELCERTQAAIDLWRDVPARRRLLTRIMKTDFSWGTSATKYLELYRGL